MARSASSVRSLKLRRWLTATRAAAIFSRMLICRSTLARGFLYGLDELIAEVLGAFPQRRS
jgi:hypothetical protein